MKNVLTECAGNRANQGTNEERWQISGKGAYFSAKAPMVATAQRAVAQRSSAIFESESIENNASPP
jgi:hypothetical protein